MNKQGTSIVKITPKVRQFIMGIIEEQLERDLEHDTGTIMEPNFTKQELAATKPKVNK